MGGNPMGGGFRGWRGGVGAGRKTGERGEYYQVRASLVFSILAP